MTLKGMGSWHRKVARGVPNGPGGHSWVGEVPVRDPAPIPLPGTFVVYVLYDISGEPIYVGSTEYFQVRLGQHVRDGKPAAYWMAFPCADREAAYEMEERLLAEHMPALNRRVCVRAPDYSVPTAAIDKVVTAFEAIERAEQQYRDILRRALAAGRSQAEISRRLGRTREMLRRDAMTEEQRETLRLAEAERKRRTKGGGG